MRANGTMVVVMAMVAALAMPAMASAQSLAPSTVASTTVASTTPPVQQHHVLAGVVGGGVLVFTVGWVGAMTLSAMGSADAHAFNALGLHVLPGNEVWGWGVVPFVGPLVQAGFGGWADTGYATFITESLVQFAGLAMVIGGIVGVHRLETQVAPGATLSFAPMMGTTNGVSATLTF